MSLLRVRDAKLCMVAVFGIIFVVEIEQKRATKYNTSHKIYLSKSKITD